MEDFVTYEIAVKLRKKGFRNKCIAYYLMGFDGWSLHYNVNSPTNRSAILQSFNQMLLNCTIDAPTTSQVLKWLREEKHIYVISVPYSDMSTIDRVMWYYEVKYHSDGAFMGAINSLEGYMKSEEAALAGIQYVIDNLI